MTVVVRIEWHFLAESVDIAEQLEIRLVGLTLCSQVSCSLKRRLSDLMNLEYPGIVEEDISQKSKNIEKSTF
jgi:hypothetical protein